MPLLMGFALSEAHAQGGPPARYHTTAQSSGARTVPADQSPTAKNSVSISIRNGRRIIQANGIPSHAVGAFPNGGNPHSITSQRYTYSVTATPRLARQSSKLEMRQNFGIGINGVPFDPGAAEWYRSNRQSIWQYEALAGAVALGIDSNHAHVQPNGAYHYHGLPTGLLRNLKISS